MASSAAPDPQPPASPPLFSLPADLEIIEYLRRWIDGGADAVPSWIRPAEVYDHRPSDLIASHQAATAADGSAAWFLVTTLRHRGPQDQRIKRAAGGGTWKGELALPLVSHPDGAHLGSKRNLSYVLKAADGRDMRTGHLMREYLLAGGAGRVAGSDGDEFALCMIYNTPRAAEIAAAKALEKAANKASRAAARAAKAQEKAAAEARRAQEKEATKARRAAAKAAKAQQRAQQRASAKAQERAAADAAAAATPPRLLAVPTAAYRTPPPPAAAAATPPLLLAVPTAACRTPPPPAAAAATTPPLLAVPPAPTPAIVSLSPAAGPTAALVAALTPTLEDSTSPPRRAASPSLSPPRQAQTATSSPAASVSSPPKRLLLLQVGADDYKVYQAQQVEDEAPFKKRKLIDCSGWYLLDARHKEKLCGAPCTTA